MQVLNEAEQIAHLQEKTGLDRNVAVCDILMAYRDTPHPVPGITPYQALSNTSIRTKLDHTIPRERSGHRLGKQTLQLSLFVTNRRTTIHTM